LGFAVYYINKFFIFNMPKNSQVNIIIQLDNDLQVYVAGVGDSTSKNSPFECIHQRSVALKSHQIRLYTIFGAIWEELLDSVKGLEISDLVLIIGPQAGFTDSRIIYMWLKSHALFYPNSSIKVIKSADTIDLNNLKKSDYEGLLAQATVELQYGQEPRIGVKTV
jgi:hypothetical protein